jgi:hypothetical protein
MMAPGLPKVAEKYGMTAFISIFYVSNPIMTNYTARHHEPYNSRDDSFYFSHFVRFWTAYPSTIIGNVWPHMGMLLSYFVVVQFS